MTSISIRPPKFRCSELYRLMGGISKTELTEKQKKTLAEYMQRDADPDAKPLTDNQREEMERLITKRDTPPELSDGAKTYVREVWLAENKGFVKDFESLYTRKGIQAEQDSLQLMTDVIGELFIKNEVGKRKGTLGGTPDVVKVFRRKDDGEKRRHIYDAKSCWDPGTFMSKKESDSAYDWQGKGYMYLFDADLFTLVYTLVDCPEPVYADAYRRFCWNNDIVDDSLPEYAKMVQAFELANKFTQNPVYSKSERIKWYTIERDPADDKLIEERLKMAEEFYYTIRMQDFA